MMNRGVHMAISVRKRAVAGGFSLLVLTVGVEPAAAVESSSRPAIANTLTRQVAVVAATNLPSCDRIEYRGRSGTISVQTDFNGYVQWGIYMHNAADDDGPWWVDVYVSTDPGSTRKKDRVDRKQPPEQMYAPHGSVSPVDAVSGKVFHIVARHVTTDGKESNSVTNGCLIP